MEDLRKNMFGKAQILKESTKRIGKIASNQSLENNIIR